MALPNWYAAEVLTVIDGTRLLGASMACKLSDDQLQALHLLGSFAAMQVAYITHTDALGGDHTEWVWARDIETLESYARVQDDVRSGALTRYEYWRVMGAAFGYTAEATQDFIEWITQDPCPCPCPQCRPDLFTSP